MHARLADPVDVKDEGVIGHVGPNAVIQLAHALNDCCGPSTTRQVFERAGFLFLLDTLPAEMIDERIASLLFEALWEVLPSEDAACVARDAGRRTAEYILANRIPSIAKIVLRGLPARLAAPLLLRAIEKNAWTFAGSGICTTATGPPAAITIVNNPLAMPTCAWHRGVFECLFGSLVSPRTRVTHPECCAAGQSQCRFELCS